MHARYLGSNFALKLNLQTYLVVSWKVSKIIFEIMKTYGGIPERSSCLIFKLKFTIGILVDWILLDAKGSHRPKWIIWQILKYFIIGTFHKGWKWNKYLFFEEFFMSFHFNLYLGTFTVSRTKCAISKWMWPKPLLWQAKQVMLSVGICVFPKACVQNWYCRVIFKLISPKRCCFYLTSAKKASRFWRILNVKNGDF